MRPDLQVIADLITPGARVLDLGCGEGELLAYLAERKGVVGRGIELDETNMLTCVRRGLSVRQGNLEEGLADYPPASFDYVVLSQTLPFLDKPMFILDEMVRVGVHAIISFPNWGYWRCRLELLINGRIPQAPNLPQSWWRAPRWQALTITDFARLAHRKHYRITRQVYLTNGRVSPIRRAKNLMATTAVLQLERGAAPQTDKSEGVRG